MSVTSVTVPGVVKPDGTLELQGKIGLPAGKVQVTVEVLSRAPTDHPFWQMMEEIWAARRQAGLQPRSVEEVEAELRRFREEMERAINEADRLVEAEIKRHNWRLMREIVGPATKIPLALQELFSANTPRAVEGAYWKLENHVVVQGQLFEVAICVVPVLLAALVNPDRPRFVRIGILELLFQIVNGVAHEDEKERGFADLAERCKRAAKDGLWLLYREFLVGESEAAKEIIEIIDDDTSRLPFLDRMRSTR